MKRGSCITFRDHSPTRISHGKLGAMLLQKLLQILLLLVGLKMGGYELWHRYDEHLVFGKVIKIVTQKNEERLVIREVIRDADGKDEEKETELLLDSRGVK